MILNFLNLLKTDCEVCEVNEETIQKRLNLSYKNFEDAVQYFIAIQFGFNYYY